MAKALLNDWVRRVNRHEEDVSVLYTEKAVFIGTFRPTVSTGRAKIRSYFKALEPRLRAVAVRWSTTQHLTPDVAVISGEYEFHLLRKKVLARFSMTCCRRAGGWRIANHHSSKA